jgi:hypothetical protein
MVPIFVSEMLSLQITHKDLYPVDRGDNWSLAYQTSEDKWSRQMTAVLAMASMANRNQP